jgi:hypothetical protein
MKPIKVLTPIKAIRAKCLDCMNHQTKEIRLCPMTTCPLWSYRMGKRPTKDDADVIGDDSDPDDDKKGNEQKTRTIIFSSTWGAFSYTEN